LPIYEFEIFGSTFHFYLEAGKQSWPAASDVCYERGLELASLPFPALAKELHARIMAIPHSIQMYWIGASDLDADGKYAWNDGTPWGTYTNWEQGFAPGYVDGNLCVGVYTRHAHGGTVDGVWAKMQCDHPWPSSWAFVCGSARGEPLTRRLRRAPVQPFDCPCMSRAEHFLACALQTLHCRHRQLHRLHVRTPAIIYHLPPRLLHAL
jgi:hypothetical protein